MKHIDKRDVSIWAQFMAYGITLLFVYVYMHNLKETITMDATVYKHVGMMDIKDGDSHLYTPVFRRVR